MTDVSVPDADEYEIFVTNEEATELRQLLNIHEDSDFSAAARNILLNPLENEETKELRDDRNENLKRIYQFVYEHGTAKTKDKVKTLGIM